MFDFATYRAQLEASRMTRGIVPHPAVQLLTSPSGLPLTSPLAVCLVGRPAEPSKTVLPYSNPPQTSLTFPPGYSPYPEPLFGHASNPAVTPDQDKPGEVIQRRMEAYRQRIEEEARLNERRLQADIRRLEPGAELERVWTDFNVERGGEEGMLIHTRLAIDNLQCEKFQAIAFFHIDDGSGETIKTSADGFQTVDGGLCVFDCFTPHYQFTTFEDFQLFLPFRTLYHRDAGKWPIKYQLVLRRMGGSWPELARSGWQRFQFTLAPRAGIENVWTDHNVDRGGEQGMLIHTNFEVDNLCGQQCEAVGFVHFDDARENVVRTSAKDFQTIEGGLCVWKDFSPSYQFTHFKDLQLFLPYRTISVEASGKWDLKVQVVIRGKSPGGALLGESKWQRFKLTR